MTGIYQGPAKMQARAYDLWQENVNSKGGILGKPVKVIVVDDKSDKNKSQEIYLNFVDKQRVDLVIGPYSSQVTMAVAPIVDRFGYPTLLPGAAADRIWKQGYKNVFGIFITASKYALEMLKLGVLHDLQKVAVVFADDEFSIEVAGGARNVTSLNRQELVVYEKFKKGT